ncbi:MAG TPA: nucleotide exchange factor GrpE [Candidatus Eisenbacteria bacterium]
MSTHFNDGRTPADNADDREFEAGPDGDPGFTDDPESEGAGASSRVEAGPGAAHAGADGVAADDRYLRLLAEFDNFRRRSHRDREQAVQLGIERLASPLFDVLDNLERALAHAVATAPGPWMDGVALTARQFSEAFKSAGITAIDPLGEPFDSAWHEALGHAPSASVPADHVVTVVSPGYRLGDRLLRPARVLISSGGATND